MAKRDPTLQRKRTQTQWAAQFLAASELVRRGYTVSFTMGNHTPDADLMVGAPSGRQFWVDVKGLSVKNAWLVSPKKRRLNLYYVLVYVEKNRRAAHQSDRFFVLTQPEVGRLIRRYEKSTPNSRHTMRGFNWTDPHRFENDWTKLPR